MTASSDHVSQILEQWNRERPDLDTRPIAVIGRLHRVGDALRERLLEVYRRYGLGEGEFDILATLRRSGDPYELTPGELATQTMVTSGAVSKRLDRLESGGYVSRRGRDGDGRGRVVALTDSGRMLIDDAFAAHMANEAELLRPVSAADRAALERILAAWAEQLGL